MSRRQFARNSVTAIGQVVVSGLAMFATYWYLARTIGLSELGVWSVVLATTTVGSIANLGIASSTVKFVASHLAKGDERRAVSVIETSAVSVAVVIGLVALVGYPVFAKVIEVVVPVDGFDSAISILPFALVSFWLSSILATLLSGIDGFNRIDLRGIVVASGSLIFLILVVILAPTKGLVGVAIAQVIQNGVVAITCYVLLRRLVSPSTAILPRWSKSVFREILAYSLQFQLITFCRLLVEPVAKGLLSKYGSLEATGLFEMASKLVILLRSLLVNAYQSLVPAVAKLAEISPERVSQIYRSAFQFIVVCVLLAIPMTVIASRLVSTVWLGSSEEFFVTSLNVVGAAWFVNTLSGPAYFFNLGTGELTDNVVGHVVTALVNVGLGLLLAIQFSSIGVVVAYCAAVVAGSLVTTTLHHNRKSYRTTELLGGDSTFVVIASVAGLAVALYIFSLFDNIYVGSGIALLAFLSVVSYPVMRHSIAKEFVEVLKSGLSD